MKRILILFFMGLLVGHLWGQDLTGRIYQNTNIDMNQLADNVKVNSKDSLTLEQREKMKKIINEAFQLSMTVEFKSGNKVQMKSKFKMDDDKAKQLGIPWLQRKTLSMAMTSASSAMSMTEKYVVQDSLILSADDESVIMKLRNDGLQLELPQDSVKSVILDLIR